MITLKKALLRSVGVIVIVTLSVLSGLLVNYILDIMDRREYPMPEEYAGYVAKYSKEYGVPENIIYAVIKTESDFDISAKSTDGGIGLMRIMPSTFEWMTDLLDESYESGMLYDPETNIKYGTYYLAYLSTLYTRWPTVYAAYNAGTSAVDEWLSDGKYSKDGMSIDNIPYDETREYVKAVTKAAEYYQKLYY